MILTFTLFLGSSLTRSYQDDACVCGSRKTLLVLADFPEYPHLADRGEITTIFFNRVTRYFYDVSYGRLDMSGNATDWIRLPKLYSQYAGADLHTSLENIAKDAFYSASASFNMTTFDYVFLVLSFYPGLTGDYVSLASSPITTTTGVVRGFAVVEEDRDWTAFAHAFALGLGLWRLQLQLSGMGTNDLAASGTGDMSSWSKAALGWVNRSQVVNVDVPANRILTLDPVEDPGANPLALQINLGTGAGQYWVEVRDPLGYDRNNLQDYGAILNYFPSNNGTIQLKKTLQPEIISTAVFIDSTFDLSIVALNVTQGRYRLLVGDEQVGRNAQTAVYSISRAQDAIDVAENESRFNNIALAQTLLANARDLFALGKMTDADAMAVSAAATADAATVPPDYSQATQLIGAAEALKNSTAIQSLSQGNQLRQANAQLEMAKRAFETKDFTTAKQAAQTAIDLYNRAKQMELIDNILSILGNLVLIVPVVILAFALRYQLKGS